VYFFFIHFFCYWIDNSNLTDSYRYGIVSIPYRYHIDTVSIPYRYRIDTYFWQKKIKNRYRIVIGCKKWTSVLSRLHFYFLSSSILLVIFLNFQSLFLAMIASNTKFLPIKIASDTKSSLAISPVIQNHY
jgi:hypothetical protein